MKGKRRIPPILVSALLTAGMLFCNGTSVQAELNFGELGSENNQIAAPAAGIAASSEAIALDDLGISIAPGSYISIEQTDGFVYVYTQESGTIPYVIVGCYNITAEDFTDQFTAFTGAASHFYLGGMPDITVLILCAVSTLVFARLAAVFANKASAKTLNRALGIVLTVLGVVILAVKFFQ